MWFGTRDELNRYDRPGEWFNHYRRILSAEYINTLIQDTCGNIWVA